MNIWRKLWRNCIFFVGDIRREHCLGGLAWGRFHHYIDYAEAQYGNTFAKPGYIGLHRNRGDASNSAITGFMKHAWIWINTNEIVESVSEGVVKRHPFHALMSDYVVILKPIVSINARQTAVQRALLMEGAPYDDTFTFDLEKENEIFKDKETALANMREYGLGITCSEGCALAYVGYRHELGLYRTKLGKRQVILPDAFLSTHFEVVWASKETTPENAKLLGLQEEGKIMLQLYWNQYK